MPYDITKADLFKDFPYSKVLQSHFGSTGVFRLARDKIEPICKKHRAGKISLEQAKAQIDLEVYVLKIMYPNEFPAVGWLTKQMAKVDTLEYTTPTGKVKIRNICKICKGDIIRSANTRLYSVVEIDGDYWKVCKGCSV